MKAASRGDLEAVQSHLSEGASPNEQDIFGHTALSYAVSGRHADVLLLLLNSGADVYLKNRNGKTVLDVAKSKSFTDISYLLKLSCLLFATRDGDIKRVKQLLADGADADGAINDGWTALMIATVNGHKDVVQALVAHGVDLNVRNANGWTAMMIAVRKGYGEIIEMLEEFEARKQGREALLGEPKLPGVN